VPGAVGHPLPASPVALTEPETRQARYARDEIGMIEVKGLQLVQGLTGGDAGKRQNPISATYGLFSRTRCRQDIPRAMSTSRRGRRIW